MSDQEPEQNPTSEPQDLEAEGSDPAPVHPADTSSDTGISDENPVEHPLPEPKPTDEEEKQKIPPQEATPDDDKSEAPKQPSDNPPTPTEQAASPSPKPESHVSTNGESSTQPANPFAAIKTSLEPSSSEPGISPLTGSGTLLASAGTRGTPLRHLPENLKGSIHNFKMAGFASQHFSKHRMGRLFSKKKIPLEAMIAFQREPITKPMLKKLESADKKIIKATVDNFADILTYMGIRASGKEPLGAAAVAGNVTSNQKRASLTLGRAKTQAAQNIVSRGVNLAQIRDEIYIQLIKQTTPDSRLASTFDILLALDEHRSKRARTATEEADIATKAHERAEQGEKRRNEDREEADAIEKGWQLINLCAASFAPSRDFECTLLAHIDRAMEDGTGGDASTPDAADEAASPPSDHPAQPPPSNAFAHASAGGGASSSDNVFADAAVGGTTASSGAPPRREKTPEAIEFEHHLQRVSTLALYALNRLQNTALFGSDSKARSSANDAKTFANSLDNVAELTDTRRVYGCALNEIMMRQQQNPHYNYTPSGLGPMDGSSASASSSGSSTEPSEASAGAGAASEGQPEDEELVTPEIQPLVDCESKFTVPLVLVFLSMKLCSGSFLRTEGIFRKSITLPEIDYWVMCLNNGEYTVNSTNAHTYAVLIKTWLTRLSDTPVPPTLHPAAIKAAETPAASIAFAEGSLPPQNLQLLKYLCRLLRLVCLPELEATNRMGINNLTMVFTPPLVSLTTDPAQAMTFLKTEMQLVTNFIQGLYPTAEEAALFEAMEAFVCTRCGIRLQPHILELLKSVSSK